MRQILLRISLENPWTFGPVDGLAGIGIGGVWLLFGLFLLGTGCWRSRSWKPAVDGGSIATWVLAGLAALTAPSWAPASSFPIYSYGFMLFLGFIAAAWLGAHRAQQAGLDGSLVWDVAMWIFLAGIAGARAFYLIQYREQAFAGKEGFEIISTIFNLPQGGLVLLGGVVPGLLAFLYFCRRKQIHPLQLADILTPSIFVGLAFGRLGCFMNGCCYGDVCELPWAVQFPAGSVPFHGMLSQGRIEPGMASTPPLHPTQIYSSIMAVVLAVITSQYYKRRPRTGAVLALACLLYPINRFVLEELRSDEPGQFGTSLTISQWVSMGLFLFGIGFSIWLSRRPGDVPPASENLTTAETPSDKPSSQNTTGRSSRKATA